MRIPLILFGLLLSVLSYSQSSKTVTGTVYYQETKEPVPFGYVKLEGISYGTVTDFDGTFSLRIPEKYYDRNLEFSYVGLKDYSFKISTYDAPVKIYMETDVQELYTVVINAKRDMNPKSILKKALKAIPENYVNEPFNLSGFYREYVKENSTPVKYADAAFLLDLAPYTGKEEKKKAFENPVDLTGITTIGSWSSRSSSMHRWHFHQKVLKGEKAQITNSKASEDLNTTRLYANVQGGPLSALTKDRIKYPANFVSKFSKYDYELLEVEKNGEGYFLVSFKPEMTAERMEKKKRAFNYEYKLGGTILIRKEDLAITEIKYSVPPEYKKFICGYRGWSVRHFDFSVESRYEKQGDKYVLDYMKHADEFIVEDTAANRRVPYAAISEFFTHDITVQRKLDVAKDDNFSNSDYTFLFDYPEGYDSTFWKNYELEYPSSRIPEDIYASMSAKTPLEKQFANKLVRDTTMVPPVATKEPNSFQLHGQRLEDSYAWLKDTKNPLGNMEVMQYLSDENAYTENYFKPLKPLQREIFKEVKSYVQDYFQSLPTIEGGYKYYYVYKENDEHPVYYRKQLKEGKKAELMFDVNKLAEDHAYYNLGGLRLSPNNKIVAYSENKTANDRWELKFKNLETGKTLYHSIDYVGGMIWLSDSTIAFTKLDQQTFQSSKVFKYSLKTGETNLIYEEQDKRFSVGISRSRSKEFAFIRASSSDENELQVLNLKTPDAPWRMMVPRRKNHKYSVSHFEDKFYILTNHKATNSKLMIADTADFNEKNWKEEIAHNPEVELISVLPFKNWMVYQERHGLEYKVRVVKVADGKEHYIKQDKNMAVSLGINKDFDTDTLRISKATYNRPLVIYDYDMEKKKSNRLKSIGKFSPMYFAKVETVYAEAKDGTKIPITLMYNKAIQKRYEKEGKKPYLYITGYGSYGSSNTPGYNPNIAPLLQKGFVYAIAHVRGGGDLGDEWYKDGKLLNKKNSFTDFIDCTEYLISEGYGETGKVVAQGGSAGGLLMGAVANMRPDLYKLVILDVPFVDVINTMLDDKLPLTSLEYDEWGNPNEKKSFKYIKSYSPYDNVESKDYPNMLFLTAINDSRVGYWEPAKMVAKLRDMKTDKNEVFLRTDFSAGHGGASGRYASLAQTAFKYALILEMVSE